MNWSTKSVFFQHHAHDCSVTLIMFYYCFITYVVILTEILNQSIITVICSLKVSEGTDKSSSRQ